MDHATQRDEIIKRNTSNRGPRTQPSAKRQTAALMSLDAQHRKKVTTIDTDWPPRIEEIDAVTWG